MKSKQQFGFLLRLRKIVDGIESQLEFSQPQLFIASYILVSIPCSYDQSKTNK